MTDATMPALLAMALPALLFLYLLWRREWEWAGLYLAISFAITAWIKCDVLFSHLWNPSAPQRASLGWAIIGSVLYFGGMIGAMRGASTLRTLFIALAAMETLFVGIVPLYRFAFNLDQPVYFIVNGQNVSNALGATVIIIFALLPTMIGIPWMLARQSASEKTIIATALSRYGQLSGIGVVAFMVFSTCFVAWGYIGYGPFAGIPQSPAFPMQQSLVGPNAIFGMLIGAVIFLFWIFPQRFFEPVVKLLEASQNINSGPLEEMAHPLWRDIARNLDESRREAMESQKERQNAERALAEEQANLLAFFNYAPLQVYITDLDHKIVMVNDWVHRETGAEVFRPENVIGLSADQMVPTSWAEQSHDNDATVVEKGGVTQVEVRGQFGGKERDIISIRFPIKDADGQVIRIGGFVVDVTAQMDARREAEQSRALLEAFFGHVPIYMGLFSTSGQFLTGTQSTLDLYGMSAEEMGSAGPERLASFWPEFDRVFATHMNVVQTGKPERFVTPFKPAPDAKELLFDVTAFPIRSADGTVVQIGSLATDITDQRQDQKELARSQAMLQAFFDNIPAMTFIISPDRRYVTANRYAADKNGMEFLSPENLIGQPDTASTPPEWHPIIAEAHRTVVEEGKPYVNETSIDLPGGTYHLLVSRFPIRNAEGEITHVGGLLFDRTAERQAEAALAEREATLQAFFDNLPGLAFLSSSDGEIIAANSYMTEHFGIPNMRSENLVGKKGRDLLPRSWNAHADEAIQTNEKTGKAYGFEQTIKLPDGERHVSSVRFPIRNKEGETTHIGGLVFDRTVEKQAADAVNTAREGLHQSEKLAALGQLLAGVAHELNNPLAIVMGRAAMLKEKLAGTPHEDSIQRLRDAADRCARIVKTFITMARQTGPQRTMVQIPDLIEAALDMTGHGLRAAGITLEQQIATDLPDLTADGDQLIQVFINLIVNAQHAMEGQADDPRLLIAARQAAGGKRVIVEISDNGPGVAVDLAAKIFDPFFTTKDVGLGTGLGLSVCQSMIEAHGGTLELAKPVIGGATFRISLPLGEAQPSAEFKPESAKAHRGAALIVDDEEEVADILAEMLDGMGLACTVVTSGQAALEAIASHNFDAIFSDVRMPRMGGSELLAAIQRDYPDMASRIIFATGDVLHPQVDTLRATGRPIVEKPYDPQQLSAVLNEMLKTGEAP